MSIFTFDLPLRLNRVNPKLASIWPNTGLISIFRLEKIDEPSLDKSFSATIFFNAWYFLL